MRTELTEKNIAMMKRNKLKQKKRQYKIMNSNASDTEKLELLTEVQKNVGLYYKVYKYREMLKCASRC